jgi:hypothetical protein
MLRPNTRHPTLTAAELDAAFHAHESGLSWSAVAGKFSTCRHPLQKQLRAAGYVLTKNRTGPAKPGSTPRAVPAKSSADAVAMRGFSKLSHEFLMRPL